MSSPRRCFISFSLAGECPAQPTPRALGDHGHHGAIDRAEGVMYRLEHGPRVIALAKLVRLDKQDGVLLADHSGGDHVWNTWHDGGAP